MNAAKYIENTLLFFSVSLHYGVMPGKKLSKLGNRLNRILKTGVAICTIQTVTSINFFLKGNKKAAVFSIGTQHSLL